MERLRTVVHTQRWGIAEVAPAGWTLYFKGGWGSGTGLVDHQVALLTARPRAGVRRDPHDDLRHPPRRQGDAPRRRAAAAARALARGARLERGDQRRLARVRRLLGEEALGRAAAAERAQAARAVLGHEVGERAEAAGAHAHGGEVDPLALGVEDAISSSMPWSGWTLETAITSVALVAERAQRGAEVAHGADAP